MVAIAVWILTLAAAAGCILALWHLRATSRPPIAAGVAHAVVAAIGLVALLLSLIGPPRGVANGVAGFGTAAAVLFVAALVTGLLVLALRRGSLLLAVHAAIAITGYCLLLAWYSLG